MKKSIFLLCLAGLLFSCFISCKQGKRPAETAEATEQIILHPGLEPLWETPAGLNVPESVIFDAERDQYFVSNIGGQPSEKNAEGFISRLSADGEIVELEWVAGLNAPKGMGIVENFLYVTDIDRVVKIDISKAEVAEEFAFPDALFLNDIDVDQTGNVYVSDMRAGKVYRIAGQTISLMAEGEMMNSPNGLFVDGDHLLIGVRDSILSVPLEGGEPELFIAGTGGIDGLEKVKEGVYVISDWTGNVHLVYTDRDKLKILDTTPLEINAADIEFIPGKNILLVPTFFDNRVMAYRWSGQD
jgi:sugar lactone lactonase YvrE